MLDSFLVGCAHSIKQINKVINSSYEKQLSFCVWNIPVKKIFHC